MPFIGKMRIMVSSIARLIGIRLLNFYTPIHTMHRCRGAGWEGGHDLTTFAPALHPEQAAGSGH